MITPLFSTSAAPRPLWPHQARALDDLRHAFREGTSRIVLMMATGGGKTRLSAEIIHLARKKGRRVAFVVPRLTLVDQAVDAFQREGITDIGVMQGVHFMTDATARTQVISAQTLARRKRPDVDVVIVDECHEQHAAILEWMEASPEVRFVGLSATPGARGMGQHWERLLIVATAAELIGEGVLVPPITYAPGVPDLSGVRTSGGDYLEGELADRMNTKQIVGDVVREWKKRAQGRPTLVFAVNRSHAKHLQGCFNDEGIRAAYIDANTPQFERMQMFGALERGEIKVITNIDVLTAGVDLPFVGCISDVRPTRSAIRYVQSIGRGLRSHPGKRDCLILDHAGNALRLGLAPDVTFSELDKGDKRAAGDRKDEGKSQPLPRLCENCKVVMPPRAEVCPMCGKTHHIKTNILARDGELVPFGSKQRGNGMSYSEKAAFYSELAGHARERGYRPGFAVAVFKERFGAWPDDTMKSAPPKLPTRQTINWIRHRQIAHAKAKQRASA